MPGYHPGGGSGYAIPWQTTRTEIQVAFTLQKGKPPILIP